MNYKLDHAPAHYTSEFGPLGYLFCWIDRHPRTAAALLWLSAAALMYAVFTYDFTTRI
jgi:hypothetical protein